MKNYTRPKHWIRRILPFTVWMPELRKRKVFTADLTAGVTVALVLIPQSMANAELAGLPPYYGLYASFLPAIIAALFGSSRQLSTGPVALVSLMTATVLQPIATEGSDSYIAYAILIALMVGLFQLILGLLRLGILVSFLSFPAVLGFVNAASIIIATSQLDNIFGVSIDKASHHYEAVWHTLVVGITNIHWPTFIIAALAFTIMIILPKINPRIPFVLIAVVISTLISWIIGFEKTQTIKVEQISDQRVYKKVNKQLNLQQEIEQLEKKIYAREQELARNRDKYEQTDLQTLFGPHQLDLLKLEQCINLASASMKELKKTEFKHVRKKNGFEVFYPNGSVPKNARVENASWSIKNIKEDGTLVIRSGGKVVGDIPKGLPSFKAPSLNINIILQLLMGVVAIALIGFMSAVSIAKTIASKTRVRFDPNQELVGQGLANFAGSFFSSFVVSGSFARSSVNFSAGAVTGFSSIVTSLIVFLTLLLLTPLFYYLPLATLAAVIMIAVVKLVNIKAIKHAWQIHHHDGIVAIATFISTLAFAPHLHKGIMAGIALSLILYIYRSMRPQMAELSRHQDGTLRNAESYGLQTCSEIAVLRFDGSLYFANSSYFEDKVLEKIASKPKLQYIILDAQGINQLDATGEDMLRGLIQRLHESGVEILFTRVKKRVMDIMERTGFSDEVGRGRFFRKTEQALHYVFKKLDDNHRENCPLNIPRPIKKANK